MSQAREYRGKSSFPRLQSATTGTILSSLTETNGAKKTFAHPNNEHIT